MISSRIDNIQDLGVSQKPVFENQVGIGKYKVGSHWKDLPILKKIWDVFKSVVKISILPTVAGVITFSAVAPPLSLVLVPTVASVLAVSGIYLVGKSLINLHKMKDSADVPLSPNTPRLGQWSSNNVHVTSNGPESMQMKLKLIASAQRSIEISGSYCGGKIFNEALDLIRERLQENPELTVKIISNKDLLTSSNYEKIKELAKTYPDRFFLLETRKQFIFFPTLRTEENHTKLLIVDESICMTGGTGIQDMLSREDVGEGVKLSQKEKLMGKGARDMDVVIEGPLAKTMRHQFYQLLAKWGTKTSEKRKFGTLQSEGYEPVDVQRASILPTGVATNATMIASSYEHGRSNESKLAYIQMIREAKQSIVIANMCLNQPEILEELRKAALKGVDIKVITNTDNKRSPISMKMMGIANRSALARLKRTKASFYEYYKDSTLYHKKVMVIDDKITTMGSFNISLHCADTEDEDLVVFDSAEVAKKTMVTLREDIENSKLILNSRYLGLVGVLRDAVNTIRSKLVLSFTAHVFQ